jgi:WD40 repeat protein
LSEETLVPEMTPDQFASRRDDLRDWLHFAIAESHVLTQAPQLLFQQAFNFSSDSAPVRTARKRFEEGSELRPWLRRINKRGGRSPCLLTLTGHDGGINFCGFSSDGSAIVTTSFDGRLKLWDAASGRELSSLSLGPDPTPCAIAPGGLRVVVMYGHRWWKDTKVLDLADGRDLFSVYARPEPPPEPISLRWGAMKIDLGIGPPEGETYWNTSSVAFSADGKLMVVVGYWYGKWIEYTRIFETTTWEEIATFEGPKVEISYDKGRATFSPDAALLVLSSTRSVRILRVVDGTEVVTLPIGGSITFTSDGRLLVAYGNDSEQDRFVIMVRSWNTTTWTELEPLKLYVGAAGVGAISPDARRIALTSGNTVKICDLAPNAEALSLGEHGQHITCCAFSEDGQRLVTGASGDVKVWDATVTEGSEDAPHNSAVNACTYSPDGSLLATASDDGTAKIWTATGRQVAVIPHGVGVHWAGFSPDGSKLLTRSELRLAMLWDAKTGRNIARMGPHCYHLLSCAYSPDGSRIISGTGVGYVGELWLWDGETGEFILSLDGHKTWINHCLFTADSKRVLSISNDGRMRLWNVRTGKLIAIILGDSDFPPGEFSMQIVKWALSPDGLRIVAGLEDGSVRLWDGKSGKLISALIGQGGRMSACAFSPDGRLLATGNRRDYGSTGRHETCVKLWDAATGAELATLAERRLRGEREIDECTFSPDCKLLFAESSSYGTGDVVGWDIASRAEVVRIAGKPAVRGFSPDGSLMVIGRKTLRIWDIRSWSEVARYMSTGADSVAWNPDGSLLALGELSGDLHVLRIENRTTPATVVEAPRKPRKPRAPRAPRPTATPRAPRAPRAKVPRAEAVSEAQTAHAPVKRRRKTPSPPEVVIEAPAPLEQASTSTHSIVDVPQAHPAANPNRAMELNLKYQEELKRWNALSWWKRLRIKKPVRPSGI